MGSFMLFADMSVMSWRNSKGREVVLDLMPRLTSWEKSGIIRQKLLPRVTHKIDIQTTLPDITKHGPYSTNPRSRQNSKPGTNPSPSRRLLDRKDPLPSLGQRCQSLIYPLHSRPIQRNPRNPTPEEPPDIARSIEIDSQHPRHQARRSNMSRLPHRIRR